MAAWGSAPGGAGTGFTVLRRLRLPARLRALPGWVREVLLVGILYGGYELIRGLQSGTFRVASRNGWDVLRWERMWDLSPERLLTHALLHVTPLAVAAAYFYSTMHYIITPIVLVWMYRKHSDHYRTARTSLAISTLLGLAVFYVLPTAPPRLLAGAGVPDVLAGLRNWGWWGGDGSVPRGLGSVTNQFAAMPSLHVGWALWCGFLLVRYSSRTYIRVLGAVYPVVTALVVLSTGNHYLLDALAGVAVMGIGLAGALGWGALLRRLGGLRDAAPAVVEVEVEVEVATVRTNAERTNTARTDTARTNTVPPVAVRPRPRHRPSPYRTVTARRDAAQLRRQVIAHPPARPEDMPEQLPEADVPACASR